MVDYACNQCRRSYTTIGSLQRHIRETHQVQPRHRADSKRCHICTQVFRTVREAREHITRRSCRRRQRVLIRVPEFDDQTNICPPQPDEDLNEIYQANWSSIRSSLYRRNYQDILNCRLTRVNGDVEPEGAVEAMRRVWGLYNCAYKVNVSFGVVLRHSSNGRLRYYHASSNNAALFPNALLLRSRVDLEEFLTTFTNIDPQQDGLNRRPNSSWVLHRVTNVTFYIYKVTGTHRIGTTGSNNSTSTSIAHRKKSIWSMTTRRSTGVLWGDNLCFFRCLAAGYHWDPEKSELVKHKNNISPLQSHTYTLFKVWANTQSDPSQNPKDFIGVCIEDLWTLECLFDLNICVLTLQDDSVSNVVWSSGCPRKHNINLHYERDHFSLITDVSVYAKSFSCGMCAQTFTSKWRAGTHSCSSRDVTKYQFKGKPYTTPKSIFDKLADAGISVKKDLQYFPYRITYDIETYMDKNTIPESTESCKYEATHVLMSVSVCSNVPSYTTPKCFVSQGCSSSLVREFVTYMLRISKKATQLMNAKFRNIKSSLNDLCDKLSSIESSSYVYGLVGSPQGVWEKRERLCGLDDELERYLSVIPVISFNGQNYDVNVMKNDLISTLIALDSAGDSEGNGIKFTIKRQSAMSCFESLHLRFVDITNFIAPGSSYAGYLKTFGVSERKGFFPYEWVDSLDKLNQPCLPPRDAFYSSLSNKSISEEDYSFCHDIWKSEDMTSMRDFLVWYNNNDVVPFLDAIEAQMRIYKDKGIDMLKQCVSLPGAAHLWLMNTCDMSRKILPRNSWVRFASGYQCEEDMIAHFQSQIPVLNIHEQYRELYTTCRQNMIGGPSIVFHRYHEKGRTNIRESEFGSSAKPCKSIEGFDANALYAFCVAQPQPVGHPVVCEYEDNILQKSDSPGTSGWSKKSHEWLTLISCRDGIDIQHKNNVGEVKLGQHGVRVDGFASTQKTVYEFNGCYWHGHPICLKEISDEQKRMFIATSKKREYLERLGYSVVTMWECEWDNLTRTNALVKEFVKMFQKVWYPRWSPLSSMMSVVKAVQRKEFFGLIQCDIHVPDNLESKFSEMSPLFGHVKLTEDMLSPHMKEFVKERAWNVGSRKSLVGVCRASKILLHSELLKWYLDEGLVVTKVYKTYRYKSSEIFQLFVEQATNARREGDRDPSLSLLANMAKLSVNSVYGKTITNMEKHRNIKYSDDPSFIASTISSGLFVSLDEFDDICELVKHKSTLDMTTPVVIGFSILQTAKLCMLKFYYNCIDKYVCRRDFQYIEMDTDSAYMALSGSLHEVIKPELRLDFFQNYGSWFPKVYCSVHKHAFVSCMLRGEQWNPMDCCKKVSKHDSRTPGLFKQEFVGTGMVALNSKTYVCWDDETGELKQSSKGISKRLNSLQGETYKSVLETKNSFIGQNRGFINKDHKIVTYSQMRAGLTYFYGKRGVEADGVSTYPLNINIQF